MENISGKELNDILLRSDLFKCKCCKQILRFPIMYVEKLGNICGSCVNSNEQNALQNIEMENVLSKLIVPCRFEKNGCKVKCKSTYILQHENICNYHNLICPYTYFNECIQKQITNIVEHFEEVHTHSIILSTTDTVKLCFHINTTYNQLNLLVINNEKFLARIVPDLDDKRIYYSIYYMGNLEQIDNFSCTIEHVAKNMKVEANAILIHESMFSHNLDKSKAISFSMMLLQEIFKDNINVSIKIVLKSSIPPSDIYEQLLTSFECRICDGFMRPPIFQCISGHSICNKCKPKVNHCPTCRSSYGSTRNYDLENLSSIIRYPCLFRDCGQYFSVDDISQHENECILKPFHCPFSEYLHCNWDGSLSSVAGHLKTVHPDQIVCDNICTETILYSNDQQFFQMKCLLAFGKIFRVCHQRHIGNQNGYWSVQVIAPKGEAKKYTCHIALIDIKNPNKTLIRTDLCQDLTRQDFMFNHCIAIPLNVVSWFSNNGQLQFYYKVLCHS